MKRISNATRSNKLWRVLDYLSNNNAKSRLFDQKRHLIGFVRQALKFNELASIAHLCEFGRDRFEFIRIAFRDLLLLSDFNEIAKYASKDERSDQDAMDDAPKDDSANRGDDDSEDFHIIEEGGDVVASFCA